MNSSRYTLEQINAEIERREKLAALNKEIEKRSNSPKSQSRYQKYIAPTIDAATEGLERSGAGIGQIVYPVIDKITGTNLEKRLEAERKYSSDKFQQKYKNDPYTRASAYIAEAIPYALGAGEIKAASGPISEILAKNALSGGIGSSTTYDPTGSKTGVTGAAKKFVPGALSGGILGGTVSGIANSPTLIKKGISGLGSISLQDFKKAHNDLGDIGASLGDIIKSPSLKKLQESGLESIPFSGTEKTQINRAHKIVKEGKDLLGSLKVEEYNDNPGSYIKDVLNKNYKSTYEKSDQLYDLVNKISKDNKIYVTGENYSDEAKKILKEIQLGTFTKSISNKDMDALKSQLKSILSQNKSTKEIKFPNKDINNSKLSLKKALSQQIINKTNPTEQKAESIQSGSFSDANIAKSLLNEKSKEYFSFKKRYLGNSYYRLAEALKKDMQNTIEGSKNDELKKAYAEAENHYANNVAPFKDNNISKFINENADSDTIINHFLKTNTDRANLLGKLLNKTSQKDKNAVAHSFLSKAYIQKENNNTKELSPVALVNTYNRLGTRTRDLLFSKDFQEKMENYSMKVKNNLSSLNSMQNPKTGYRNLNSLKTLLAGAAGGAGVLSGHPASTMLAASIPVGANLANRALNSKKVRELYLKSLMSNYNPGSISSGLAGISSVLPYK